MFHLTTAAPGGLWLRLFLITTIKTDLLFYFTFRSGLFGRLCTCILMFMWFWVMWSTMRYRKGLTDTLFIAFHLFDMQLADISQFSVSDSSLISASVHVLCRQEGFRLPAWGHISAVPSASSTSLSRDLLHTVTAVRSHYEAKVFREQESVCSFRLSENPPLHFCAADDCVLH